MYQTQNKCPEEIFKEIIESFECSIGFDPTFGKEDDSEWDLKSEYRPNWACAWNKLNNLGTPCKILQKDSRFAVVTFKDDQPKEDDLLRFIYRLEDLIIKT